MATIVRGTVPADEFALHHTLSALPDAKVECERVIRSGEDAVMPLLWTRFVEPDVVEERLEEDPSVESVSRLSEFEDENEMLYRMDWVDQIDLLLQMLTNAEATVLDAYGQGDTWQLRVLYPTRDKFSTTHDFADDHGLTFDVEAVREMDGEPAGRFGLTESQYQALVLAVERGYFEVPRETKLQELAEEVGISHQALSERLRRASGALIQDALLVGATTHDKAFQ